MSDTNPELQALRDSLDRPAPIQDSATPEPLPNLSGVHTHRCMRCREEFTCQTPDACMAKYDAMPSIITRGPNGPVITDHCTKGPDGVWRSVHPQPFEPGPGFGKALIEAGEYLQSSEFPGFGYDAILKAYAAGAVDGRQFLPDDEQVERSADAYVKSVAPKRPAAPEGHGFDKAPPIPESGPTFANRLHWCIGSRVEWENETEDPKRAAFLRGAIQASRSSVYPDSWKKRNGSETSTAPAFVRSSIISSPTSSRRLTRPSNDRP